MQARLAPLDAVLSTAADPHAAASRLLDRVGDLYHLPEQVVGDLRIAIDEILTNIVSYAYRDASPHDIHVRCELRDGLLQTTVEDDGVAYNPLTSAPPDMAGSMATRRVGGLGVHFVKNLMNAVRYERVGGRNRLILEQGLTAGGSS